MSFVVPIILAGGQGQRLWPLSTQSYPKQFLPLINQYSLFQNTLQRLADFSYLEPALVVTLESYRFILQEQIQALNMEATILLERQPHNTTAAIALATHYALTKYEDPLLLILPCDHIIDDVKNFSHLIETSFELAKLGKLITFGVLPTYPATNYGYIQKGQPIENTDAWAVESFKEKPDESLAQSYFTSHAYFWNSGIFLFRASVFLKELQQHAPEISMACKKAMKAQQVTKDFVYIDDSLEECPNLPIDRVIFEKTSHAIVLQWSGNWQDLGSWEALYAVSPKDELGNVVLGEHIMSVATTNSYLYSTKPELHVSGLNNCCVVATEEAVLVTHLHKSDA